MSEARQARRYFVSGMVQGVGFRFFTRDEAGRLGLSGYVRNLRDGRVEVYAAGSTDQLARLRLAIERGPTGAMVSQVEEEPASFDRQYEGSFRITYES